MEVHFNPRQLKALGVDHEAIVHPDQELEGVVLRMNLLENGECHVNLEASLRGPKCPLELEELAMTRLAQAFERALGAHGVLEPTGGILFPLDGEGTCSIRGRSVTLPKDWQD